MRIGLFCGCFDPIHLGHIRAAEACRSSAGLERVLFVPASDKYGKAGLSMQSGLHRLAMCRLALNNCEGFDVCPFELESPDAPYTSETAAYVQGLYPGAELYLCLGEDAARYAMRSPPPGRLPRRCRLSRTACPRPQCVGSSRAVRIIYRSWIRQCIGISGKSPYMYKTKKRRTSL